jgi:hypothetical protein
MKTTTADVQLQRLVGRLGDCLTEESARRLLALKADRKLQARVAHLADRSSEGLLTPEEAAEYNSYVKFGTFVAILKSKARQRLAVAQGEG